MYDLTDMPDLHDVNIEDSATGAIVLAAGGSTRMGRPKQLLPFNGRPLLRHVVEQVLGAACHPVIVVLGHEADACRAALDGLSVTAIVNPAWETGMGSSVRAGVDALTAMTTGRDRDVAAVLLLTCDQPFVSSPFLNRLISRQIETRRPMVATSHDGLPGVPAVFAEALFERLRALDGDRGARVLLREAGADLVMEGAPDVAIDLDTPADYARLGEPDGGR